MEPEDSLAMAEDFRDHGYVAIAELIEHIYNSPDDEYHALYITMFEELHAEASIGESYSLPRSAFHANYGNGTWGMVTATSYGFFLPFYRMLRSYSDADQLALHAVEEACRERLLVRISPELFNLQ